jgi:hypothetical protein
MTYATLSFSPRDITPIDAYPTAVGSIEHANEDAHEESNAVTVPSQLALFNQEPKMVTSAGNCVDVKLGGNI